MNEGTANKLTFTLDQRDVFEEDNQKLEQALLSSMMNQKTLSQLLEKYAIDVQQNQTFNNIYLGDGAFEVGEFIESIAEMLKNNANSIKNLLDDRAKRV